MIFKIPKRILAVTLSVAVILAATIAATARAEQDSVVLPVIMYHHISANSNALGEYVVSPEQFRSDLVYLKEQGYTTVSAKQLADFVSGKGTLPEKPILITFDDGYASFYAYAFPILKKLQMKAVFSIIGTHTDRYSQIGDSNVNYAHVTWEQAAEMSQSGLVEIGNHTYDLHRIDARKGCRIKRGENEEDYRKMLTEDVVKLQKKITEATGETPTVFTYPFGFHCSQGCEVINKLGFEVTLGCEEKVNRLTKGSPEGLKMLGRYNRASGKSSEDFFWQIIEMGA